jgi:hypothetical protein
MLTLTEARQNFQAFKAAERRHIGYARAPRPDEYPPTVDEKVATAIKTLSEALGFSTLSVWAPGAPAEGDAQVQAIFFAKDEDALMAAAVDFVTGDKSAS